MKPIVWLAGTLPHCLSLARSLDALTIHGGRLQDVAAALDEARQQHTEAHAQEVVQLQQAVEQDDGQQAAERDVAQLFHGTQRLCNGRTGARGV